MSRNWYLIEKKAKGAGRQAAVWAFSPAALWLLRGQDEEPRAGLGRGPYPSSAHRTKQQVPKFPGMEHVGFDGKSVQNIPF